VMRVLSRLTENGGNIASTTTKQQITQQLCSIYPAHRSGDFTQSVM
jgi:adenine-specific DNA glycosylase